MYFSFFFFTFLAVDNGVKRPTYNCVYFKIYISLYSGSVASLISHLTITLRCIRFKRGRGCKAHVFGSRWSKIKTNTYSALFGTIAEMGAHSIISLINAIDHTILGRSRTAVCTLTGFDGVYASVVSLK